MHVHAYEYTLCLWMYTCVHMKVTMLYVHANVCIYKTHRHTYFCVHACMHMRVCASDCIHVVPRGDSQM